MNYNKKHKKRENPIILKVRKKPIVVESIQWNGDNFDELEKWCPYGLSLFSKNMQLYVRTLEGELTANIGDYILKGVDGELYPVNKEIFEKTYDVLEKKIGRRLGRLGRRLKKICRKKSYHTEWRY